MEEKPPFVSFWHSNCTASVSEHFLHYWSSFYFSNKAPIYQHSCFLAKNSQYVSKLDIFGCVYFCAQNNSTGMYWAATPIAYHNTQAASILTKKMTSGGLTDNLLFKSQSNLMGLRTEDKYSISFAGKRHSWHHWLHVSSRAATLVTVSSITFEHNYMTTDVMAVFLGVYFNICILTNCVIHLPRTASKYQSTKANLVVWDWTDYKATVSILRHH